LASPVEKSLGFCLIYGYRRDFPGKFDERWDFVNLYDCCNLLGDFVSWPGSISKEVIVACQPRSPSYEQRYLLPPLEIWIVEEVLEASIDAWARPLSF
jgi:hypothetical protein